MIISTIFVICLCKIILKRGSIIELMPICAGLYMIIFGINMFTEHTCMLIDEGKTTNHFTLMSYYLLSHIISPIIIAVIGIDIYNDMNIVMHEDKQSLSYHAATQKIKKFPRFIKQYAFKYYTNTHH